MEVSYRKGAIQPLVCYRLAWQFIKEDYWIFLIICLVGILLGSLAPLGVLMGPMMCGIYLCLFGKLAQEKITFDKLLKGFDFFLPSFIATIIQMIPVIILIVPMNFYFIFVMSQDMQVLQQSSDPAVAQAWLFSFLLKMIPGFGIMMILMLATTALFMFSYPLIVEKKLSGWEAIQTSARSALANLGGVLALVFLNMFLGLIGACCCYVGVIFILPITMTANFMAYRQVFGEVA